MHRITLQTTKRTLWFDHSSMNDAIQFYQYWEAVKNNGHPFQGEPIISVTNSVIDDCDTFGLAAYENGAIF